VSGKGSGKDDLGQCLDDTCKGSGKDDLVQFLDDTWKQSSGLRPEYLLMSHNDYAAIKAFLEQPMPDIYAGDVRSPISGAEMNAMNCVFGNKFTAEVCNHFMPGQTYYADHRTAVPIDNPFRQITPTPWRVP
jgi:hypothetical protein